jgi:membrane protein implicated in regulation of membrane protease activity
MPKTLVFILLSEILGVAAFSIASGHPEAIPWLAGLVWALTGFLTAALAGKRHSRQRRETESQDQQEIGVTRPGADST